MIGKLPSTALVGAALTVASWLSYMYGIPWLPVILMIMASLTLLGLSMMIEDELIAEYDTPHDEDAHPPALILFRAARSIIMVTMGVMIFCVAM